MSRPGNPNPPLVSILVPTYNGAHCLADLCRSIQAQTYPYFEVVILDDASTDETRTVLAAFETDPRFKVTAKRVNGGFGQTLRELLSMGRGDYWVAPGQDDTLFPEFLERRVALMQAHPDAAIAHGAVEITDASGKTVPNPFPPLHQSAQLTGARALEILLQHNIITFPSALVRYAFTRKILPFFLTDWHFVQDWHLWILHLAAGDGLLWDDRPASTYRVHPRAITWDPTKAAMRRAEVRLAPLCALKAASPFSPVAAAHYARWRKTLYHLWLLRALRMRFQGLLLPQWLQQAGEAYYGADPGRVSLASEYLKHAPGVALAALRERKAIAKQSFRVAGLAEINDPLFQSNGLPPRAPK